MSKHVPEPSEEIVRLSEPSAISPEDDSLSPDQRDSEKQPESEVEERLSLTGRILSRLGSVASSVRSRVQEMFREKPKPRKRALGFGGMEQLESRLLLSATPALVAAYEHVQTLEANPETVTETVIQHLEIDFNGLQNGLLPEQSIITEDGIRLQLWTSNNQGIHTSGGVVSSGADGKDHIIQKFVDGPVLVSAVDMQNISGTTGGKINVALGDTNHYFDLPASGELVLPEPILADMVSFIAQNGRGAGFDDITVRKSVTETRETEAYVQELAEARALVAALEAEEGVPEEAEETSPASITFAGLTAGNLDASLTAAGATVTLPVLGTVRVNSGGFTPMRVTEDGGLKTGVNQGHMTLSFDTPTYVESVTVSQSGSGVRKYNLGSGYQEMVGLTEIPVGAEMSQLTFIVYGDAEVEIVGINIPQQEETEDVQQQDIVVDVPKAVELPFLSERSGNTEARSTNWDDILATPTQSAYFSNLQVMSQWWAPGGQFIGMKSMLSFQAPTVAAGLRIASATLVFNGTNKLNTTGAPLSLHAVANGAGSLGSISYDDFIVGENSMTLDPARVFGHEGVINIELKTSMDLLNQPPSKSGNNAYSFSLGTVADGDSAPTLLLTYEAIPVGEEAPLSADILSQKTLSPVAFAGSTAMVHIRPDVVSGTVSFEGEQTVNPYLSAETFTKTNGIPTLATVSLDGMNPSGVYSIVVRDDAGIEISRISVIWNKDTKTLSLQDGDATYTPTEAEQASINDAAEIMHLSLVDLGVGEKNFAATQQAILLNATRDIIGLHDFQVMFDRAHPEWNEGVMYAKAQADSQTSNFSFDQIYTSLRHQKSDTMGILRQDYGAYEWMLGDFMKQAMSILAKMRAGVSQRDAVLGLQDIMYRQSYSLPMYRLASIGVRFPSTDTVLRAAAAVSNDVMHDLLRVKEDERQAFLREQEASNNPSYAGTGESEELLAQRAAEEKAAHLHNLTVIAQSEGDGDPLARAWAYGTNNGLTEEEMREVLDNELTEERVAALNGVSDAIVDGVSIENIDTANERTEIIKQKISNRVQLRLDARLAEMTLAERSNARGLLRMQRDGIFDEYLENLFAPGNQITSNSEAILENISGYKVIYLLDSDAVMGNGHAAMIMGSDAEGWYYFSFGSGKNIFTSADNMDVDFYLTLNDAKNDEKTNRYEYSVSWDINRESMRSAFKEASSKTSLSYNLLTQNCDDIAIAIIEASGVELDDKIRPNMTYLNFYEAGYKTESWRIILDQ